MTDKKLLDVISEAVGAKGLYKGPVAMSFAHQFEGGSGEIHHHLAIYPNEEAAHKAIHQYFIDGDPNDPEKNEWLEDEEYKNADARARTKMHVSNERDMGGEFKYKIVTLHQ